MARTNTEAVGLEDFRVLGTRPIRHDGFEKVTGRAKYGADVDMAGLLWAAMLRSPWAHARIKSIDTSKAAALEGVRAVMVGDDLPEPLPGGSMRETHANLKVIRDNALAQDKVLYKGHALVAIAATSFHIAEQAVGLVEVEYEILSPVLDVLSAMNKDSVLVHDDISAMGRGPGPAGTMADLPPNAASHTQFKIGDLAQGFEDADVIVERELRTKPVHQGYIEPHNSTSWWDSNGKLTVWTSTQGAFIVRQQLAHMLHLSPNDVTVVPMEIGGGFGGKIDTYMDPVTAVLSKKTGRPVKMVMSRKEVFEGTGPASGSLIRSKMGAKYDGTITAAQLWFGFEAGAYPGSAVGAACMCGLAPYQIENVQVDGYDVVVNKQKVAAYRAPGAPLGAYAVETVVDELAEKLGMDPMELRRKNVSRSGDRQVTGVPFPAIGCVEVEEAMANHRHYKDPLTGAHRGRGTSVGYWFNAGMQSSATINVNSDGTVSLVTGSVDIGGSRTALSMQAAEVLGIAAEDVHPSVADTASVGWTGHTGGSRTAYTTGIAVINAAENVKAQIIRRAAALWEINPEDIVYSRGLMTSSQRPGDEVTFKVIAGQLMRTGGPVTASAHSDADANGGVGPVFAGTIVDVEVDPETGKVDILRATIFQDVGRAAHPSYVEGQMQGGTVQGLGWALNEEYFFSDDGAMLNSSFLDYRMPTSLDLPMIDTVIIEVSNPGHPFGLRGVGEVSLVPSLAAVANAVSHAVKNRITSLPIRPGIVLDALEQKDD